MSIPAFVQRTAASDGSTTFRMRFDEPDPGPDILETRVLAFSECGLIFESGAEFTIGASIAIMTAKNRIDCRGSVAWVGGKLIACDLEGPLPVTTILALSHSADEPAGRAATAPSPAASLGARLVQLRRAKGMKQDDLAALLSVSGPAISNWESDRSRPRPARLEAMARIFGVSLTELLGLHEQDDFREQIYRARLSIAQAAGVDEENVRIRIDL